jgi:hypothetical protein
MNYCGVSFPVARHKAGHDDGEASEARIPRKSPGTAEVYRRGGRPKQTDEASSLRSELYESYTLFSAIEVLLQNITPK